jgi:hypothetical protein
VQAYDVFVQGTMHQRFPQLVLGDLRLSVQRHNYGQYLLYSTGHGLAATVAAIPMLVYARGPACEAMTGDPFTQRIVHRLRGWAPWC